MTYTAQLCLSGGARELGDREGLDTGPSEMQNILSYSDSCQLIFDLSEGG